MNETGGISRRLSDISAKQIMYLDRGAGAYDREAFC
jgi:hypothetical protein